MADTTPSTLTTEPSRFAIRLPHWGWLLLATVVLIVGYVGVSVWLPWHREQHLISWIESFGGYAHVGRELIGPAWLIELIGERRMQKLKVFDRVRLVQLRGTKVNDAEIARLSQFRNLDYLNRDDTLVTDVGLAQLIKGMASLKIKHLRLSKTGCTDVGLAHLNGLTNLKWLTLNDTAVTERGVEKRRNALPFCLIDH